jgi:hypothetical protein
MKNVEAIGLKNYRIEVPLPNKFHTNLPVASKAGGRKKTDGHIDRMVTS